MLSIFTSKKGTRPWGTAVGLSGPQAGQTWRCVIARTPADIVSFPLEPHLPSLNAPNSAILRLSLYMLETRQSLYK